MIAVFAVAGLAEVVADLAEVVAERGAGSRRCFERDLSGSGGPCGTGDEPFGVQETTADDDPSTYLVAEARTARTRSEQAGEAAATATRTAAEELVRRGLTMREAGVLLGLSHQRIAQLVG